MNPTASSFKALLSEHGNRVLPLQSAWIDAMAEHWEMLVRWNRQINLTRITGPEEAVLRHYCESLLVAANLPPGINTIADLGSGAGFPGVPIAIAEPHLSVTLIESHQRKCAFLRESTRSLPNIHVLAARAETVTERFDLVVSRAVRWQDVLAANLAPHAALLLGKADAEDAVKRDGFTWNVIGGWPLEATSRLVIGSST